MRTTRDAFYNKLNEWYPSIVDTLNDITEYIASNIQMENTDDIAYDCVWDGSMTMIFVGANDSIKIHLFGTTKDDSGISVEYGLRDRESEQEEHSPDYMFYNEITGEYTKWSNVPPDKRRCVVLDKPQWIIQGIAYQVCEYQHGETLRYSEEIQAILISHMPEEKKVSIVNSCVTPEQMEEAIRLFGSLENFR